jgi:hypothetical protein
MLGVVMAVLLAAWENLASMRLARIQLPRLARA